ncbi:GNAT family N-acetyltransferase [Oryzibacter oryziterrae]|uniref:GNAT family N-acetyltransferase n=1 Tax=Oryzibacter oryziterrae TaxID=2766474 RepID=UPI001F2DEDDB|nr:GNAT family N-acetyltransferase [Oryzibacter oryziterrae]
MGRKSEYTVSVVSDVKSVAAQFRTDTSELLRSPFQHRAWLEAWFQTFLPLHDDDCHVAMIRSAATGLPVFILPLVYEERDGLKFLTLPDRGVTDYQAPMISPSFNPTPTEFSALWHRLLKHLPTADVLVIEKCPKLIAGARNPFVDLTSTRPSRFNRHPLLLDAPFEVLRENRFDGTCMRSLARKRRKLENKGRLEFAFEPANNDLFALDQILNWRETRFAGENSPEKAGIDRKFYHALCRQPDIARLGCLRLDGELISGCFGTVVGDSFQLLMMAHAEPWKNWSPGLLAVESAIEWACRQDLKVFDFTIGTESYKHSFGVMTEPLVEVLEPLSLSGTAYVAMLKARRFASDTLRKARHTVDEGLHAARSVQDQFQAALAGLFGAPATH